MLEELKLSNFRLFDDEVTVRFRPITVLIGRNSSGKSSIVKFLLMLKQSSTSGQSRLLNSEGDKVSLGAFVDLKNSLTTKRYLTFELRVSTASNMVAPFVTGLLESVSEEEGESLLCKVQANVLYSRRINRGRVSYSLATLFAGKQLHSFDVKPLEDSSLWDYPPIPSERRPASLASGNDEIPKSLGSRSKRVEELQRLLTRRFAERSIVDTLLYQINSIRHLLPVRAESQRVILASSPPADDVGQQGEYTMLHLQQLASESNSGYEFIRAHLENIVGIEAIRFRTSAGYVSRAYARSKITGADVLIADYGFGVGQCLPILVQGAIMAPQTTLIVEQPEAQLHPTAQLELGSFFADLWTQRKVTSIIETHSGNVLLRLRRLIARGDLSHKDVSVAYFTFDRRATDNMPTIREPRHQGGWFHGSRPANGILRGQTSSRGLKLGVREHD